MTGQSTPSPGAIRALAPLAQRDFRRIWTASLLSNLAQLVLGVAAAWEMLRLTSSPQMVALVQTALMLPMMLVSVPAGAVADMFDRRRIAMTGLAFSAAAAALLTALSLMGLAGPWVLLAFCFLIGGGMALYAPSWQSSIPEQVPAADLPAAVSLGSVSYNVARSFGPALGGILVVLFGASVVFGLTALFYLPLLLAFYAWQRRHVPPRLPPERLGRAIVSGVRYALHSPVVRTCMIRSASYGIAAGGTLALAPLIAHDVLHGDAGTLGILLGAVGVGAVTGALVVSEVRDRFMLDAALACALLASAVAVGVVAWSSSLLVTAAALCVSGAANMIVVSLLNVAIQLSVPRWVAARALAWFSSSLTGGMALGAWVWGRTAAQFGVAEAVAASGLFMAIQPLLGLLTPLRDAEGGDLSPVEVAGEPDVDLDITARSGPIRLEIAYRVDPARARQFYDAMLDLQGVRQRNGGFGWALARDIARRDAWVEQFEFPTWADYLRHRDRFTAADGAIRDTVAGLCEGEPQIRRLLDRPFGSVRWKADSPDANDEGVRRYAP